MKKKYLLLMSLLFASQFWAQTTENFEDETHGSTTFTNNGRTFTISSQAGGTFDIQGGYPNSGYTGTNDNKFIDNDGSAAFNTAVQFTVSSASPFYLKSLYLFLTDEDLNFNFSGTLTITGKLAGATVFTATKNSGFNNSYSTNNGFTFINMATLGGQNNSSVAIDSFVISTTSGINYVALDGMTWQVPPCSAVTVSPVSKTNVACFGGSTGSATASASGGTGLTYNWTPGNPSGDGTATATGLTAGTWTVTVTNACGNIGSTSFTITEPTALSATQSQNNVTCSGGTNGSASVSASGGTPGYTYSWSPSGGNAATATGLSAGNYAVTITDANGCSTVRNFTITTISTITATTSQTNVTCNGASTGAASVTPSGGAAPYSYSWSPSGGNAATATGLAAGNYMVTITDANGCFITKNFAIAQPAALTATQSQANVACYGSSTGSASVSVSGGTGSYTYTWSPSGGNASTATGLAAGNYSVLIKDNNNCSITKFFTIFQPTELSATSTQNNVTCNGGTNGSASVSASGGTFPYTYSWSPSGGTGATASGLSAGNYTVTITDNNNCSIQKNFTITAPSAITATQSQTNITCNGGSNGTATVVASGGTGTYTYSWSPSGGTGATATGLSAGAYTVTITDASNCSIQKNFTILNAADCSIATTWNGTSWGNGTPDCNAYAATINGNYDSALHGEITACSLTVTSGTVVVDSGDNFIIKGIVNVSGGSLTFENNSNLIQSDNVTNTGTITYYRNSSSLYKLDYTIWSSPVTGSQSLKQFSPETLDESFMVYNTALNAYSNYLSASGIFGGNPATVTFAKAKGYLIRMPDTMAANTPSVFTGIFTGTPNNGNILIALNTQGNRFNAVGNPYPSPINVQDFLTTNQANLDNGTLYFWRKRNGATGTTYATVTMAAYVAGTAEGGDTSGGAFEDGEEENWVINPGQGFLVKASTTAGALSFTNSMRRAVNNGQFFRTDGDNANIPPLTGPTSKLWLNITSENNDFGQAAIAYTDVTTLGLDYGYDGRLFNDGVVALYSMADETRLAIQARESFNVQDEVPLGFRTSTAGNYSIDIDKYTGVFADGQSVYLKDTTLGLLHSLTTDGAYSFTSESGTFNDRFYVVYSTPLAIDTNKFDANSIVISKKQNSIRISSGSQTMQNIKIYDLRGRLIHELDDVNASKTTIANLAAQEQMLIVNVTTADGTTVSKKIIY